ncbi:MAG TPA: hypothetical protein VF434_08585, partial [Promineifilum sp.]
PKPGEYEYFVQAVDNAGNVNPVLDHGNYFKTSASGSEIGETLYVSVVMAGSVGGVSFDKNDIIRLTPAGEWEMYFDGSDVGLSTTSIKAFEIMDDGSVLITVAGPTTIGELGQVTTTDIVRFVPTSTGETTAGSYVWYFQGIDVSLSPDSESIDAISIDPDGKLILRVKTNATVDLWPSGTLTVGKADLLAFTFSTGGADTSGTWALYLDADDTGITKQNVDAAWVDPENGDVYLSVDKNFKFGGIEGKPGTVFVCDPATSAPIGSCAYSVYWDATAAGIVKNIEGIDIQR